MNPSGSSRIGPSGGWSRNLFHVEAPPRRADYFSLVIPPPNVTGSLHMGHMFEHSIIDAQVRWQRMLREDHAVAAGHRSRRHRHADHGGAAARRQKV